VTLLGIKLVNLLSTTRSVSPVILPFTTMAGLHGREVESVAEGGWIPRRESNYETESNGSGGAV
jgi:hypothetical protein